MPHVYLAGPFFSPAQLERIKLLEGLLDQCRVSYYSPRKFLTLTSHSTEQERKSVFIANKQELDDCSLVLACLDDIDVRAIWEIGYAHGNITPIVGLYEDSEAKINLVLAESCLGFLLGIDSIVNFVRSIKRGFDFNFIFDMEEIYKWKKGVEQ